MTLKSRMARSGVSSVTKGDRTLIFCQYISLKGVTINRQNL
ncbi:MULTISPECIES: hypothetical protein [unclassified Microcoleus]